MSLVQLIRPVHGKHQSPINIKTDIACFDQNLLTKPLWINYDDDCCDELLNTGGTFQINIKPMQNSSY